MTLIVLVDAVAVEVVDVVVFLGRANVVNATTATMRTATHTATIAQRLRFLRPAVFGAASAFTAGSATGLQRDP
jgi:hypothetical protein